MKPSIVALIPARAGSKRIPGKNTRPLAGHPLIAYTIAAAQESGIFSEIVVCSDDDAAIGIGADMGVGCYLREPSADDEPDVAWVARVLPLVACDRFAILRPTSPFRTAATIERALLRFHVSQPCDSIRAVQLASEHPAKVWRFIESSGVIRPFDKGRINYGAPIGWVPWHSAPTQVLERAYVQNASLEMAWSRCVTEMGSISGDKIVPFFTEGYEGFDLNTERDWADAERLIASGAATLPAVPVARVQTASPTL